MSGELVICCNCSTEIEQDDGFSYEGDIYCESCYDDKYCYCNTCNEVRDIEGFSQNMCSSCHDDHYTECESCGDDVLNSEMYTVEGDLICQSCYENDTQYCEDCCETYFSNHFNDSYYHSCESDNGSIRDYNYKPTPRFYPDNNSDIYYGIELEVESTDNSPKDNAESLDGIDEIYIKHDGSLSNGFEVVSHPATLEYHQNSIWESVTQRLIKQKCKSHDTTTCGLHVHMSRAGIADKTLKKFILFWYTQNNIIKSISRRDFNNYCQNKSMGMGIIPSNVLLRSETRYEQVNLQNDDTIEVRRFKGTLNHDSLLACIELVDCSRFFVDTLSYRELRDTKEAEQKFITYLMKYKKAYPHLYSKLMSKMTIKFENESE